MKKVVSILYITLLVFSNSLFAVDPPIVKENTAWADSILKKMTLDEKIGQLIMVTSNPWLKEKQRSTVIEDVGKYKIGGVLFLKSSPSDLVSQIEQYQQASKIPLFIAIDGENGLSFRMDSVNPYPNMIALGAIENDSLIYRMGREVAKQCRSLGINVNFAPVADVNSNPENPVINYRSFGENPQRVAQKCFLYAKGMQDEMLMVSVKHFPGHGNTSKDSHETLPSIEEDYEQLDSIDFLPFKTCIDGGINGIMTAHIRIPEVDKSKRPATLSKKIMTTILRDSLGFKGLIFTDAMNMKGITRQFNEGEAAVQALKAGVDVLEFVQHPEKVIAAVKNAITQGLISEDAITEKCRKIVLSKQWMGLDKTPQRQKQSLDKQLNQPEYQLTNRLLTEQSLTVIQNVDSLLPLQRLDTLKIASVAIGSKEVTPFQTGLERYALVDHFALPSDASPEELNNILKVLKNYNLIIAGIHGTKMLPSKRYNVTDIQLAAIDSFCSNYKVIFSFFTNPYTISYFKGWEKSKAAIVAYSENETAQDLTSQLIFGAVGANGKLPVTVAANLKAGVGIGVKAIDRLKFTLPEETGISSLKLNATIDSMVGKAIGEKVFPGCQVLVAKEGKVIFRKPYGHYTYDTIDKVTNESLYDWASITKITGPLPLLMKLYEDSLIGLNAPISNYLTDFKHSNKSKMILRDMLTHQAQLKSGISYHAKLMREEKKKPGTFFSESPSSLFPTRISSRLYVFADCKKKMIDEIKDSELLKEKKYAYSDLGFILFPEVIANVSHPGYTDQLYRKFYLPLGATSVGYNPVNRFPLKQVVPTERDDLFRKELLQGFVHDESAALLGGVSGNAGLFGSSLDLAKIMQFYLQGGHYGDLTLLKHETINEFTRVQFPENGNRRALGFDKPYLNNPSLSASNAYPAPGASSRSFGHSGFTGTFTWVDPETGLLFVFLTNRVYPSRENTKLIDSNFRPRLFQSIIDTQGSFSYPAY